MGVTSGHLAYVARVSSGKVGEFRNNITIREVTGYKGVAQCNHNVHRKNIYKTIEDADSFSNLRVNKLNLNMIISGKVFVQQNIREFGDIEDNVTSLKILRIFSPQ